MRKEDCKRGAEIREELWEEADRKQKKHELKIDQLMDERRKVKWSTHKLEQEKSELNERIGEERISNSRDRKNLEEEWETKLKKEKRKHDLKLQQLKKKVRSGDQIRGSLEQKIKRREKYL